MLPRLLYIVASDSFERDLPSRLRTSISGESDRRY